MTLVLIVLLAAILVGSFIPHGINIPGFKGKSKFVHLIAYFLVSIISAMIAKTWLELIIILFAIIVMSGLIEIIQYFIPGRYASFTDFLVNIAGVLLAGLIYILFTNTASAEENYRPDAKTNTQWLYISERVINNPDVMDLYGL